MADPVADSLLEYRKAFPALEDCVHFISHSLGCVPAQSQGTILAEFFELWRTKSIHGVERLAAGGRFFTRRAADRPRSSRRRPARRS